MHLRRLAGGAALAAAAVVLRVVQPALPSPGRTRPWLAATSPDQAVVAAVAMAAWLCLAWLSLGAALVLASRAPGAAGRLAAAVSHRVTPRAVRHLLEAALGAAVVAGSIAPAVPAAADPGTGTSLASVAAAAVGSLDRPVGADTDASGSAPTLLDRPVDPVAPEPTRARVSLVAATPRTEQALDGEVVVRPGDTLWDLAARHLGPGAGVVEIAAAWPEWYAANRAVIGSDPDLIQPGQRLRPPR